jgi:glycosyltransferase involved in cell wall biosynthesis
MTVFLLSQDYLPNIGGIAAHCAGLARGLRLRGAKVKIITRQRGPHPLDDPEVYSIPTCHVRRVWYAQYWRRARRLLRDLARAEKPDIIHVHTLEDALVVRGLLPGVPKVFTNHTSFFLQHVRDPKWRRTLRWLLSDFDAYIAPSDELARETTDLCGRPSDYLPNGVWLPEVDRDECRRRLDIAPDRVVILCARRFVPKNGVQFLPAAIRALELQADNALWLLAGDGPLLAWVQSELAPQAARDRVRFLGRVAPDRMPSITGAADVAVLPSLIEAVSISGLEAMAQGLPLVGTAVGGIPDLIEDDVTGLLVPPADPQAMADAVARLVASPARRQDLGAAGRRRVVERFTWDAVARATMKVYASASPQAIRGEENNAC